MIRTENDIFSKCFAFTEAERAREEGWYPYFRPIEDSHGTKVTIDGREMIMAGSNNYLGLALDTRVREAAKQAIDIYGTSCSGSRFMNGSLRLHEELERRLAEFVGKPAALCFTTGYQTNLGAISALTGKGDHILTDKLNHASILDGIFLATGITRQVNVHRYKHNNMADLETALSRIPEDEPKLIVTDGVFSMEGDIVHLPEMREIADKYHARIYLDEAHAIGVLGATGRGTCEHFGSSDLADIIMCTFSKTCGSIGGFVAGPSVVIDYIKHFARPLIVSASISPPQTAAVLKALDILESEPERVHRLQQIADKMVNGFRSLGFNIGNAETPIVPIVIGDFDKTFKFWTALFERGIYTNPVVSPAVPPNRCMHRTSYMATHTDEELDKILAVADEAGRAFGII